MTWDEIYDAAIDTGYGDSKLKRKDNARYQVVCFIEDVLGIDIENAECPEDEIDYYVEQYNILFDDNGYIINKCIWEHEGKEFNWKLFGSTCGQSTDCQRVSVNKFKFCPYCGKEIVLEE